MQLLEDEKPIESNQVHASVLNKGHTSGNDFGPKYKTLYNCFQFPQINPILAYL